MKRLPILPILAVAALLAMFVRNFWTRLGIVAALLVAQFLVFKLFAAPDARPVKLFREFA